MIQIESLVSKILDATLADLGLPIACPCEFGSEKRYRLEEVIGCGADSFVYRAIDRKLSSEGFPAHVAIKIHGSGCSTVAEAVSARRVHHDNVVQVLDSCEDENGLSYLVSELMDGGDLSELTVPCPPRRAAELIRQISNGIQALHRSGIVHGDLKPANILMTGSGVPKVADFDVASRDADPLGGGNVAFLSPELLANRLDRPTPANDIYALGGLLYYLLTGKLPNGTSKEEIRARLRLPVSPPTPAVDPQLDQICARALAYEPSDRHDSAGSLAADLVGWLKHVPVSWARISTTRRTLLWVRRRPILFAAEIFGVLLAVVVVAAIAVDRERSLEFREQAIKIKLDAAEDAAQAAKDMNAHSRAEARRALLSALGVIPLGSPNPRSVLIPSMVWLEYLAGMKVLQSDATQPALDVRIPQLVGFLSNMEAAGRAEQIDARLAFYTLATIYLYQNEWQLAAPLVRGPLASWRTALGDADPVSVTIDTMLAIVEVQSKDETPRAERIDVLTAQRARVDALGDCREAIELIDIAIGMLEQVPEQTPESELDGRDGEAEHDQSNRDSQ